MDKKQNVFGRYYQPGKPTNSDIRHTIVELFKSGHHNYNYISKECGVSHNTVRNIIEKYKSDGSISPTKHRHGYERMKSSEDILQAVKYYKFRKPSIFGTEIQHRLILDGLTTDDTVPSTSTVSKMLREDLKMSYKKLKLCPQESHTVENLRKFDIFVDEISRRNPFSLHFFDESSVLKTTGNRLYGHSIIGEKPIEVQKYASNATYTGNLLHGPFGVNYFNILDGPSNGFHMLDFFSDALQELDTFGNLCLQPGDTIVMDNCGFHHGRFAEPNLRFMLEQRQIDVLFQPPYHPVLSTCEVCFKIMKDYLRKHTKYSRNLTEVAICDGFSKVTASKSVSIFRGCGHL